MQTSYKVMFKEISQYSIKSQYHNLGVKALLLLNHLIMSTY